MRHSAVFACTFQAVGYNVSMKDELIIYKVVQYEPHERDQIYGYFDWFEGAVAQARIEATRMGYAQNLSASRPEWWDKDRYCHMQIVSVSVTVQTN